MPGNSIQPPNGASDAAVKTPPARRGVIAGMLLQRCPICREGKMFNSLVGMNKTCPVCGLVFEPEPGYFLASMYVSYALAIIIMVPVYFFLVWLLPNWPGEYVALLSVVPYVPLIPVVFRFSRVIWIYVDRQRPRRQ